MNYLDLYNKLPISMQNIAVSAEGKRIQNTRYGSAFDRAYSFWRDRLDWSGEDVLRYRDEQIRDIVRYSFEHVPFYKKEFTEAGVDPEQIQGLDDLKKLPIIDKATVRDNQALFISDEYMGKRLKTVHTSGTTGAGLTLKLTDEFDAHNWAIAWAEHNKIGLTRDMWCGYFAGRPIVPARQSEPPFYRINRPGRQIMFSTFHMNDANLYSYVDALNRYQPKWIHGYPSAVSLFASFINRTGCRLNYNVRIITLSSENVLQQQCREIKNAFGIYPHQVYGQTEGVAYFRDHKPGEIYVTENCAAVEFVRMDDNTSHIVGTNFNKAMPLIRYDTHDIAECVQTPEGRRVLAIDGRAEDYITTKDGSKIGRLDHIFKDMESVIEAQIIQHKDGRVEIRIVRSDAYTDKDEKNIIRLTDERLKDRVEYSIVYTNKIERSKNGKLRFVISDME